MAVKSSAIREHTLKHRAHTKRSPKATPTLLSESSTVCTQSGPSEVDDFDQHHRHHHYQQQQHHGPKMTMIGIGGTRLASKRKRKCVNGANDQIESSNRKSKKLKRGRDCRVPHSIDQHDEEEEEEEEEEDEGSENFNLQAIIFERTLSVREARNMDTKVLKWCLVIWDGPDPGPYWHESRCFHNEGSKLAINTFKSIYKKCCRFWSQYQHATLDSIQPLAISNVSKTMSISEPSTPSTIFTPDTTSPHLSPPALNPSIKRSFHPWQKIESELWDKILTLAERLASSEITNVRKHSELVRKLIGSSYENFYFNKFLTFKEKVKECSFVSDDQHEMAKYFTFCFYQYLSLAVMKIENTSDEPNENVHNHINNHNHNHHNNAKTATASSTTTTTSSTTTTTTAINNYNGNSNNNNNNIINDYDNYDHKNDNKTRPWPSIPKIAYYRLLFTNAAEDINYYPFWIRKQAERRFPAAKDETGRLRWLYSV